MLYLKQDFTLEMSGNRKFLQHRNQKLLFCGSINNQFLGHNAIPPTYPPRNLMADTIFLHSLLPRSSVVLLLRLEPSSLPHLTLVCSNAIVNRSPELNVHPCMLAIYMSVYLHFFIVAICTPAFLRYSHFLFQLFSAHQAHVQLAISIVASSITFISAGLQPTPFLKFAQATEHT